MRNEWLGEFGDDYTARNIPSPDDILRRRLLFAEVIDGLDPLCDVLEVGCNVGQNLTALEPLTGAVLRGLEPNDSARRRCAYPTIKGEATYLPYTHSSFDFVFTAGVLIHIPPADIDMACNELIRVSSRYIAVVEYFSEEERMVPYRGKNDMMWTRNYGRLFMQRGLNLCGYGFRWGAVTGMDSVTWWVFEK